MTTLRSAAEIRESDRKHDEYLRSHYQSWLECQHDAMRAMGKALAEVESLFIEIGDLYEADPLDEARDEAKRHISDALGIIAATTESAFGYLLYRVPDAEKPQRSAASVEAERASAS
jgi:hypothetical protein